MSTGADIPLLSPSENRVSPNLRCDFICNNNLGLLIKQSSRDLRNNLCHYFVSVLACFLAMLLALITNTVIGSASTIYLKMAEMKHGEVDIMMRASQNFANYTRFLNATRIDDLFLTQEIILTPRLEFEYTKVKYAEKSAHLNLLLINSMREHNLGIGRKWAELPLQKKECAIHQEIADALNFKINDTVRICIKSGEYFELLKTLYKGHNQEYTHKYKENINEIEFECKVTIIFDSLGGKVQVGKDSGYVLMEMESFLENLADYIRDEDPNFINFIRNFNTANIVTEILTNHPNRMELYKNSDYEDTKKSLTLFSSQLIHTMGFYPVEISIKILEDFAKLRMGAIFVKIILNLIIVVLTLLSTYLIYTMLMIYAESKEFDFSIYKTLGMAKFRIIAIIFLHALFFVIPAFILALIFCVPILILLANFLQNRLDFAINAMPSLSGILWAIGIGLFIPLLSSYFPIKHVLSQKITTNSLNAKTNGVHIEFNKNSGNLAPELVPFGIIIIAFGLCIHYFLPLALLSMDFTLLTWVLLIVLMGMIIGLVLLFSNFMHLLEKILVYVMLFYEKYVVKSIVMKSLISHKIRNRRVGLIQTLSLSFILFILVSYRLESNNNKLILLEDHVSDIEIEPNKNQYFEYSEVIELENILHGINSKYNTNIEFLWTYDKMQRYIENTDGNKKFERSFISDQGLTYKFSVNIRPIAPNFFNIANPTFLQINMENKTSDLEISEQLYTPRGSQSIGGGSFISQSLDSDINLNTPNIILAYEKSHANLIYQVRSLFLLDSSPAYSVNKKPKGTQTAFISVPSYMKYAKMNSFTQMPYEKLCIKLQNSNSLVLTEILNFVHSKEGSLSIWDYESEKSETENLKEFMDSVFYVIIVLFLTLSFFSLSNASAGNILDQTKELAVMRSIGFTYIKAVIMCIYEEIIFVMSGSIVGGIIGFGIGYTVALQRALFTDLPVKFEFPYFQVIIIIGSSLICAIICAIFPAMYVLRKQIADLAKN